MRTVEEIMMRCKLVLDRPDIVSLVDKSNSPTAAYDMVMVATKDQELAKAARWLRVLHRDYPQSYEQTVNAQRHAASGTAMKEENHAEKAVCNRPPQPDPH
jgi:hypothetical protein